MKQSRILQDIIAAIPADFADPGADYLAVRKMFAPFHGHATSEQFQLDTRSFAGVDCGFSRLAGDQSPRTVFHCHGGALVSCPLDQYHFYAEMIARQIGGTVVTPDYGLAPEHPYPAAHDDCFNAYLGLIESGVDPAQLVVVGESCGGALAVGALLRARDQGIAMPACYVSLTGWYDMSVAGDTIAESDPFLSVEWVRNRARDYLAGQLAADDPAVSPAYARLQGLPPMYLQVGQFDTMREGTLIMAANAIRAGVQLTLESWPGMIQGWHGLLTAGVPEAQSAWAAIRRYVDQQATD